MTRSAESALGAVSQDLASSSGERFRYFQALHGSSTKELERLPGAPARGADGMASDTSGRRKVEGSYLPHPKRDHSERGGPGEKSGPPDNRVASSYQTAAEDPVLRHAHKLCSGSGAG